MPIQYGVAEESIMRLRIMILTAAVALTSAGVVAFVSLGQAAASLAGYTWSD